jgi:hypothetical protein
MGLLWYKTLYDYALGWTCNGGWCSTDRYHTSKAEKEENMKTAIVTKDGKIHPPGQQWFWLRLNRIIATRSGNLIKHSTPVACVASELDEFPDGKTVRFSISVLNSLDNFDALLGRNIALARLKQGMYDGLVDRTGAKGAILAEIAAGLPNSKWRNQKAKQAKIDALAQPSLTEKQHYKIEMQPESAIVPAQVRKAAKDQIKFRRTLETIKSSPVLRQKQLDLTRLEKEIKTLLAEAKQGPH